MPVTPAPSTDPELIPQVFIGSSAEALSLARRIGEELENGKELEVRVWDKNVLRPGQTLLEGLLRLVSLFDFVVLLLSADDFVKSKEKKGHAPRDNVIFELGMFMGVLGQRRAFPVIAPDRSGRLKLPTDIDGLLYTKLTTDDINNPACFAEKIAEIREQIKERWKEAPLSLLPSAGLAYGYFNNFLVPVSERLSSLEDTRFYSNKEIRDGNFVFWILHPHLASKASIHHRDECVRKLALESVSVGHKGRSYPFFLYPERDEDGYVQFADYATTLRSSSDAIDLVLRQSALGELAEEKEQLERKEVKNFIKALQYLLKWNKSMGDFLAARIRFRPI
jgi:hypothetical protein